MPLKMLLKTFQIDFGAQAHNLGYLGLGGGYKEKKLINFAINTNYS